MKVLTAANGTILTFDPMGADDFLGLDRKRYAKGIVAERDDRNVAGLAKATIKPYDANGERSPDREDPFAFCEAKDIMRDLRWIAKTLIDIADGVEVGLKFSGRSSALDIPKDAIPTVEAQVGDAIVIGPAISPKALMNARGVVEKIVGDKVTCRMDAGDIKRITRATNKAWPQVIRVPLSTLEKA